jgi:hypothetical protein
VKSETSDRDVVHYFNAIISAQRGYYQKHEIIDVLILCGRHNIAIYFFVGGGNEDKRYCMATLRHVSKHDNILQSHLDNTVPNSKMKYIYPDTQKNIVGISDEVVREKILCFNW